MKTIVCVITAVIITVSTSSAASNAAANAKIALGVAGTVATMAAQTVAAVKIANRQGDKIVFRVTVASMPISLLSWWGISCGIKGKRPVE